jgi:hypothetical protein
VAVVPATLLLSMIDRPVVLQAQRTIAVARN